MATLTTAFVPGALRPEALSWAIPSRVQRTAVLLRYWSRLLRRVKPQWHNESERGGRLVMWS